MRRAISRITGSLLLMVTAITSVSAGDWPMWRYDAGHTAASPHELPPRLHLTWSRQEAARQPVWDDPLNRDMMPFDRIFEPVVAGGRMFVGFNDADKLAALDAADGSELWSFFADGPIRLAPVAHEDWVLFASDDGYLYCLDAATGGLRWRFRGGPSPRKVIGNRRVISTWPARGGPVVAGDTVYFTASIWPFMGTFVYALDARTGRVVWRNDETSAEYQKQPHSAPSYAGVAPQGQLAVGGRLLLVPGGRTLPAAFDRETGELRFFDFGGKGEGGSFVATDGSRAFVHTRVRGTLAMSLPGGEVTGFRVNEPVLSADRLYTAAQSSGTDGQPVVAAYDRQNRRLWQLPADGSGDLIQAGSRLYAAGSGTISAIQLPEKGGEPRVAWTLPVDGDIQRLLAAADRLFAVTAEGSLLAFGGEAGQPRTVRRSPTPLAVDADAADDASRVLEATGQGAGDALWFGVDGGQLLKAVAAASALQIAAVDPREPLVQRLRRELDGAGCYGDRVALHAGDPASFAAPPYVARLIVVQDPLSERLADPDCLARVFDSLRPYGGKLWIEVGEGLEESFAERLALRRLERASVQTVRGAVILSRDGPLPGAADWTHAYGDVANTVKSEDRRVRLPLGVLWFGGSSNLDVLPRHGHGPSEQIVDGRLFIQGMNRLSARDVYTGRVLWKRQFEDLGTFQIYYDETYEDTPLSTQYNQVHIPGANARGTNYVATSEGVYLAVRDRCLLLDAATGRTLREFVLPEDPGGDAVEWGFLGVYQDLLLAGVDFADYSRRLGYRYTPRGKKGVAWSPDHSASLGLLAFDRRTGRILWRIEAKHSFLHNGIVAGGGRVYLLDKLPQRVEEQDLRRGDEGGRAGYRVLAVDAARGEPIWSLERAFGTWLSYSERHDLLLQAGAAATDRSPDEVEAGIAVVRAADGSLVWERPDLKYVGPCILHGDMVITNSTSYRENQGAYGLLDGQPVTIRDPVTGESRPWKYVRAYGCNTAVASEHLLTFRSGAAGFYDLERHGGTGNFGGFKSGCTSNLIVAGGVLNAPDFTRTCTCGYQNQTSLAMVPMPENEVWTYNLFAREGPQPPTVRRVGINLGAPGDRLSDGGTLWINHPPDAGASPAVPVTVSGRIAWFREHSGWVSGGPLPWVAASGAEGIEGLSVQLGPAADPAKPRRFAIRLVFAEPGAEVQPGQRVFDVAIGGRTVIRGLDVAAEAGGGNRVLVRSVADVNAAGALQIAFAAGTPLPPILSGVEIIESGKPEGGERGEPAGVSRRPGSPAGSDR